MCCGLFNFKLLASYETDEKRSPPTYRLGYGPEATFYIFTHYANRKERNPSSHCYIDDFTSIR